MSAMGSVYWRNKDNRYVGKYTLPPDPLTGKRATKYVYGSKNDDSRKEKQRVRRLLNEIIEKAEQGDLSDIYKITVEGHIQNWFKIHQEKLSPTTIQGYRNYINKHILPSLGHFKLSELKPLQIEAFYQKKIKEGLNPKTVIQMHSILHKAFDVAVKNQLIAINPCDRVDRPNTEKFKINVYNEEKFNKLLDAVKDTYFELPVLLAGMCGLRRGEILGLRWKDLDLKNGTITVEQTAVVAERKIIVKKPKSETSKRTFAIPEAIIPILEKKKGIGLVCPGYKGGTMNGSTFSRLFKDFLKKNNLEHIRFHDLRHFNATMMLKYGVSDKEASVRLGHSDPSITRTIYQQVLKDMDKESANKLNNVIKNFKNKEGVKRGVN